MNEILMEFAKEVPADIYVLAHATAPFVSAESITLGIEKVEGDLYDSAFTVSKIQDFLWKDGEPFNYKLTNIPRTQDLPVLYKETSGYYIYKKEVLLNEGRRIGKMPYMVEVNEIEAIDIDEKEDFLIADAIYNHVFKK